MLLLYMDYSIIIYISFLALIKSILYLGMVRILEDYQHIQKERNHTTEFIQSDKNWKEKKQTF